MVPKPRRALIALVPWLLLAAPRASRADDFDADRPDFTNGTAVVPPRHPQLELGWTQDRYQLGHRDDTFGESLLRIGLTDRLELRLGGPDWNVSRDPGFFESGLGPPGVGLKWRLAPGDAMFSTGLLLDVGLPGGAGSFERDGYDVDGTLAGELDGEQGGVSANFTLSREGPSDARVWSGALTLSGERDWSERWSSFLEWYEVLDDTDHRPDFVDTGVMWMVAHWTQLDARIGGRIDRGEGHVFFGAGIARRF